MEIQKKPVNQLPKPQEAFKRIIFRGLFSNKAVRKTFIFIFISLFFSCIAELKADTLLNGLTTKEGCSSVNCVKYIVFYTIHLVLGWLHNYLFFCNEEFFKSIISSFLLKYYIESSQFDIEHIGIGKVHAIINKQTESAVFLLNNLCLGTFYSAFYLILFIFNLLITKSNTPQGIIMGCSFTFLLIVFTLIILACCRISFKLKRKLVVAEHKSSSLLFDILKNFSVIKSFHKETDEVTKYRSFQQRHILLGYDLHSFDCLVNLIFKSLFFVAIISSILYNKLVLKADGSSFFFTYFTTLKNFKRHINNLRDAIFKINNKFVDTVSCDIDCTTAENKQIQIISAVQHIKFEDVSIAKSDKIIFSHLNLEIPAGSKIAVTGRNGVGKSTIIKSLMGLNEYTGGIKINDCEVSEINEANLRNHFSYVPQEPHLFNMTVIENLKYGNFGISEEDIIAKCSECGVHEMITGLEKGYQTVIGENASNLSGGQAQMINFMRAYIKDAPIFLLDEPTSNLDYSTSLRMMDMIKNLLNNKTVLMTTHNPDHLKYFDKIINICHKRAEVFDSFAEFAEDGSFVDRI